MGAVALALRMWQLDDRPFQYDEGQVAYFSWLFAEQGDYHYQPLLHGPLTYFLNAASFGLFGDSDFTARLMPALAGTAIVLLPLALRRQLGHAGALGAALLLAISPSFLYYSRFDREDIILTCLELALLVVAVRFFERPRSWHPAAIGALLAACFATKEATFITAAIVGAGMVGAQIAGWPVLRRLSVPGWRPWLLGLAAFAAVFATLFSTFFTDIQGIADGVYEGPRYWAEEHEVNRGGESWPFYLVLLVFEEWLVLAIGAVGIAVGIASRRPLPLFLIWFFVGALAVYSYAGERFAWLALQPLLPLALLGGVGVQWLWSSRNRWRPTVLAATGIAALFFAWTAIDLSFNRDTDPRELPVVVHTDPDALEIRARFIDLAREDPARSLAVDTSEHGTFPWGWYFRDLEVLYVDMRSQVPDADVLLLGPEAVIFAFDRLLDYRLRRFTERRFWARDYGELTPAGLWRWKTGGQVWGELGSLRRFLLVRKPQP